MVLCLMVNCHSRSVRDNLISFYRVPAVITNQGESTEELLIERRRRWLSENLIKSGRVCSRHFVQGKPAASWDKWNVDWVPTVELGHSKKVASNTNDPELQVARSERAKECRKRQHERELMERATKLAKLNEDGGIKEKISLDSTSTSINNEDFSEYGDDDFLCEVTSKLVGLNIAECSTQTLQTKTSDSTTQTEEFDYMFKTPKPFFDREDMLEDEKVLFYTGLPTLKLLDAVYEHVAQYVTRRSLTLTKYQELVLALIKLRLNVPYQDLAYRFGAWGGRTSDKFLTENCCLLNKLMPGDLVMADRGFTIHESIAFKGAKLVMPAFTKGKSQLDPIDVESTRGIANIRIHVERVIGLLRNKYTILQGTLSTDFLMTSDQRQVPLIDSILRVCSGFVNLCPPIIPFD
eukprot:gene9843-18421_t